MTEKKSKQTNKANQEDESKIFDEFKDAVNMTAGELEKFLKTEESKGVGWVDEGESESVGHKSGRKIITLLHKKKADLTNTDIKHMQKVVGYVHRHMKQRPAGDITETRWRYSLMNWGHDPKKKAS